MVEEWQELIFSPTGKSISVDSIMSYAGAKLACERILALIIENFREQIEFQKSMDSWSECPNCEGEGL